MSASVSLSGKVGTETVLTAINLLSVPFVSYHQC